MPGLRVAAAADMPPEHPSTAGPILADTAVPAPPGQLSLQPYWSLGLVAGKFSTNWRRVSAGGNFRSLEMPVKLTYGLAPNLEVYLVAVMFQNWAGQGGKIWVGRQPFSQFHGPWRSLLHGQIPAPGGNRLATHGDRIIHA